MPFEQGKEKTGGRKKGTPNKLTKEIRDLLKSIYEEEIENIPIYLADLKPKEKLDFLIRITPYILPKVETIDLEFGEDGITWR